MFDDFLANRQSQSGALGFIGQGVTHLFEFFEDFRLIFGSYPDSSIRHAHHQVLSILFRIERYSSLVGKFNGIGEQVDDYLDQLVMISQNQGKIGGNFFLNTQFFLFHQGMGGFECPV